MVKTTTTSLLKISPTFEPQHTHIHIHIRFLMVIKAIFLWHDDAILICADWKPQIKMSHLIGVCVPLCISLN